MRIIGYLILITATVVGLGAIAGLFTGEGYLQSNMTQHVPWGLGVVMYIFFLGLSAGSFLLSTLIYVFRVKEFEAAGPMALLQALGCLMFGGFLILLDLGHPERAYKIITSFNPTSVMAWMGFFYNFYIAVVLAELYFALRVPLIKKAGAQPNLKWLYGLLTLGSKGVDVSSIKRDRKWLFILGIIGIPIAMIVHGGVGAIFAVAKARPGWFSGLFPIVFLVSALVSGGALLTLLTAIFSKQPKIEKINLLQSLTQLTVGILCFDLILMVSEILVAFYGNIPHEIISWKLMLFGPSWWIFWVIQVGLGIVAPIVLVAHPVTKKSVVGLGLAGLLVILGIVAVRYNIVIPALLVPAFENLDKAYYHPRFALGYSPSIHEWLVSLGVISLAIWGLIIAEKILPLNSSLPVEGGQRNGK